jgi:hypothetical protein
MMEEFVENAPMRENQEGNRNRKPPKGGFFVSADHED